MHVRLSPPLKLVSGGGQAVAGLGSLCQDLGQGTAECCIIFPARNGQALAPFQPVLPRQTLSL